MVSKIHRRGLSITLEIVLLLMGTTAHSQDAAKRDALLLPLPIVCTNPTAGIIYGAGVSYTTRQPAARYISVITGNATNSTNGILNLSAKSNLFTGTGRWLVNTEWRFQDNIETTYGLGSGRPGPAELSFEGLSTMRHSNIGQELQWQQLRFYQVVSRLVAPNLFAGIGFRFDRYRNIIDDKTRAGDSSSSYQYDFSVLHGFRPDHYSVSGVCINFLYDDRDNEINAYTGYYLTVNYQVNSTTFGSSQNSQVLLIDGRAYYSLDGRDFSPGSPDYPNASRNVLAFWIYGNFLTSGQLPYLALPALGYDQRQKTGRGYTFGRFRGEDLVYQESEYRFPLTGPNGRLGGVLFVNFTSTTDRDHHIQAGEYVQTGYGGGLRITVSKKLRTRIQTDVGIGQHAVALYFGMQETF